jgi:hypothetical protein
LELDIPRIFEVYFLQAESFISSNYNELLESKYRVSFHQANIEACYNLKAFCSMKTFIKKIVSSPKLYSKSELFFLFTSSVEEEQEQDVLDVSFYEWIYIKYDTNSNMSNNKTDKSSTLPFLLKPIYHCPEALTSIFNQAFFIQKEKDFNQHFHVLVSNLIHQEKFKTLVIDQSRKSLVKKNKGEPAPPLWTLEWLSWIQQTLN